MAGVHLCEGWWGLYTLSLATSHEQNEKTGVKKILCLIATLYMVIEPTT